MTFNRGKLVIQLFVRSRIRFAFVKFWMCDFIEIVISLSAYFSYCLSQCLNFLPFHRAKSNETMESSFIFDSDASSSVSNVSSTWGHITLLSTPAGQCNLNNPRHLRCSRNPIWRSTLNIFSHHLRSASLNPKTSFKMSNKLPDWTPGRAGSFFGVPQHAACISAVKRNHFSRPLLTLIVRRTLIVSSLRIVSISVSEYSGVWYELTLSHSEDFL